MPLREPATDAGATVSAKRSGGRPVLDIPYGPDPAQRLDFYPASHPTPQKLAVYLHGGGWVTGNRRGGRQLSAPFNQAGYALACVGYRLFPHTDLAGCIADTARAVGYLMAHAAQFQVETRCVLMGHSAGAHMAALLATDPTHLLAAGADPACLGTIVALDGVFDVPAFLAESRRPSLREVFGDDPATWERFSPARHVAGMRTAPRFCLMCEDSTSRFTHQVELFETALRQHGKPVDSAVVHGLKHAELILLFKNTRYPMLPFVMGNLANDFRIGGAAP